MKNLFFLLMFLPGIILANNGDPKPKIKSQITDETLIVVVGVFKDLGNGRVRCKGNREECLRREIGTSAMTASANTIEDEYGNILYSSGITPFHYEVVTHEL